MLPPVEKMRCEVTGKISYRTVREADAWIKAYASSTGYPLRSYQCDRCGGFHLTSVLKRRPRP